MKVDIGNTTNVMRRLVAQPGAALLAALAAIAVLWVAFDASLPAGLLILFCAPIVLALWALGRWAENARDKREAIDRAARLEDVTRLKSEVLQTVSHELRTPLTVLNGYIDLM